MKYIVFDLEWNSSEHRNRLVKEPIVLHGEIIQIGAVMLNEQMEEIGSFEAKIRPEFYKRINRKIEELTGITDKDLENALLFTDAINNFKNWCGDDSILLTWGPGHAMYRCSKTTSLCMIWITDGFRKNSMHS